METGYFGIRVYHYNLKIYRTSNLSIIFHLKKILYFQKDLKFLVKKGRSFYLSPLSEIYLVAVFPLCFLNM